MNARRLLILILVAVFTVALVIGFNRLRPEVTAVFPLPGAEGVLAQAPAEIQFSRAMEQDSVQSRLHFDPPMTGVYQWEGTTLTFTPARLWPRGESVQVTLDSGARSQFLGLRDSGSFSWSFTIERPRLAYLWPSDGQAEVYTLDPESGEIEQLTVTANGVLDFGFSPDGSSLFYSAATSTGGSDLYRLDRLSGESTLLLACPQASCQNPQVSPDSGLLAYQRISSTDSGLNGETQVRLLNLDTRDGDDRLVATLARPTATLAWSPNGRLAYHDAGAEAFILLNPDSGEKAEFPNATGAQGSWSPNGNSFIAPEILEPRPGAPDTPVPPSHLLLYYLADGDVDDLTLAGNLEDTDPAFSPDGTKLAFARKFLVPDRWTPGRQLWLFDLATEEPRMMTSEAIFNHTDFTWQGDGRQLAFTRFNQMTLTDPPEIWLLDMDGGSSVRLVIGGYAPQWIP